MFSRLSLRYRIALVIFLLEAGMLAAVLGVTLTESRNTVLDFDADNHTAALALLSNLSVTALLTSEYADYQLYIQDIEKQPSIKRIVLADAQNHVVAGSNVVDVAKDFSDVVPLGATDWQTRSVDTKAGRLGTLAVQFSNAALVEASDRTRDLAVMIAVSGMITIALVGLATGFALTRRLERVTYAARQFAEGRTDIRPSVGGQDEIANLAQAFNVMLGSIAQKESALRNSNRALRAVSECSAAMIHAASEEQLLNDVCRLIVEKAGYRLAWVGWTQHDALSSVRPVAQFGFEDAYLETAQISWADTPRGQGPTGKAIRNGTPVVARNILDDPAFAPWRDAAAKRGYASSLSLPLNRDGETIGALNIYAAIPDAFDADEIELLRGLAHDLSFGVNALRVRTERDQAIAGLAQRTAQFEAMFNSIPDAVIFADTDRRILLNNPAVHTMFGYSDDELIGNSTEMLYADSRDFLEQGRRRFHAGGGANNAPYEVRYKRKDGSEFWTESLGAQVKDAEGNHLGYIGIFRDITERKRAETAMHIKDSAIAASINGIAIAELNGTLTYVNQMFLRMWGYARVEDVVGRSALEFWQHPDDAARVLGALSVQDGWSGELVARRADGSTFVTLLSAFLIRDEENQPMQLMASFLDISERKKAEKTILKLNTELEQRVRDRTAQLESANKELESFSYSVSHDLRAPLRSIDGFAHVLIEDYGSQLDETARGYIERVRAAAQRMGLLIDDMLNLSRVSRAPLRSVTVNLSRLVTEIIDELRNSEPSRSVAVQITPNLTVVGDPNLLRSMLQNLLGNAWKYTRHAKHPRIEFGATVRNGAPCFFVRDNGAGFDMQFADKLFTPFTRLHNQKDFEGTGIGLATVSRIVHRHGGKVWPDAAPGRGATFFFTLGNALVETNDAVT